MLTIKVRDLWYTFYLNICVYFATCILEDHLILFNMSSVCSLAMEQWSYVLLLPKETRVNYRMYSFTVVLHYCCHYLITIL